MNRPDRTPPWAARHRRQRRPWSLFVTIAAILLITSVGTVGTVAPYLFPPPKMSGKPMKLVILTPPPKDLTEEPEEKDDPLKGQIVEIAPPEEQERPEDSDYLAEYEQTVDKETKTDRFKINPEIIAAEFSQDEQMQQEDLMDLQVDKPSTGAKVGNDRFDPDRHGTLASLPSPWQQTNKEGLQDPVPSAHMSSAVSGAPQNDLLDEERGDRVALNTREYLYAGYLNRIRRLVNFYWQQNLDNLPRSVRLSQAQYMTAVAVVLDADGALELIEVSKASGSPELDDCVVRAFRIAGPFPNPPEGLVQKDGRVYLPSMEYNVTLGTARATYQGIDPRAGVQFPGILKAPR